VQYALYYPFYRRELAVGWRDLYRSVGPGIAAAAGAAPVLLVASRALGEPTVVTFTAKIALCGLAFLLVFGSLTRWKFVDDIRARTPRPSR
jgi:hypothetical protein